jgi:hypothetical protein
MATSESNKHLGAVADDAEIDRLMTEVLAPTKVRTATNCHRLVLFALLVVGLGIDIVVLVQPLFALADHQ